LRGVEEPGLVAKNYSFEAFAPEGFNPAQSKNKVCLPSRSPASENALGFRNFGSSP